MPRNGLSESMSCRTATFRTDEDRPASSATVLAEPAAGLGPIRAGGSSRIKAKFILEGYRRRAPQNMPHGCIPRRLITHPVVPAAARVRVRPVVIDESCCREDVFDEFSCQVTSRAVVEMKIDAPQ